MFLRWGSNLVTLLWTLSIEFKSLFNCGYHATPPYSRMDHTWHMNSVIRVFSSRYLNVLLIMPTILFALLIQCRICCEKHSVFRNISSIVVPMPSYWFINATASVWYAATGCHSDPTSPHISSSWIHFQMATCLRVMQPFIPYVWLNNQFVLQDSAHLPWSRRSFVAGFREDINKLLLTNH